MRLSPVIVHGTVLSTESRWNEDHSLIVTDVRIEVLHALRGQPGSDIVVTQPGGRVGKLRVDVDGASSFRPGTETVLFLSPGSAGRFVVAGLSQGRFDVARDSRTGEKVVAGLPLPGATTGAPVRSAAETVSIPADSVGTASRTSLSPAAASSPRVLSLDKFLGDIRALVKDLEPRGKP